MACLEESKLAKLVFKKGDFELHLEKESKNYAVQPPQQQRMMAAEPLADPVFQTDSQRGGTIRTDAPGSYVTSPMVGTFYSSPGPDQPVFVKVGDKVNENTIVCIIEAMKVMNEVKAGVSGVVAEILTENSQPVEFGTRLLRIL